MKHVDISINVFNIYGPHRGREKKELWIRLERIHSITQNTPSIFIGDFNCVRFSKEMKGCTEPKQESYLFNRWVSQSTIQEVPLSNAKFTWTGPGQKGVG